METTNLSVDYHRGYNTISLQRRRIAGSSLQRKGGGHRDRQCVTKRQFYHRSFDSRISRGTWRKDCTLYSRRRRADTCPDNPSMSRTDDIESLLPHSSTLFRSAQKKTEHKLGSRTTWRSYELLNTLSNTATINKKNIVEDSHYILYLFRTGTGAEHEDNKCTQKQHSNDRLA